MGNAVLLPLGYVCVEKQESGSDLGFPTSCSHSNTPEPIFGFFVRFWDLSIPCPPPRLKSRHPAWGTGFPYSLNDPEGGGGGRRRKQDRWPRSGTHPRNPSRYPPPRPPPFLNPRPPPYPLRRQCVCRVNLAAKLGSAPPAPPPHSPVVVVCVLSPRIE